MRVCLDVSPAVHRRAGIGRYARDLGAALVPLLPAGLGVFYNDATGNLAPEPPLDVLPRQVVRSETKLWRLTVGLGDLSGHSRDDIAGGADLFHATDHLLPRFTDRVRSVCTLHDLAFLVDPSVHTLTNRLYLSAMVPRFLKRADKVICVSECTARDATRLLGLDPTKIAVVPSGVDARFHPPSRGEVASARGRLNLPERYVLYVGTVEPRKNLPTLLRAWARLRRAGDPRRLSSQASSAG